MTIEAIYENGVFRPTEKVDLPEHTRVTVEPRAVDDENDDGPAEPPSPAMTKVYEILRRSYDDMPPGLAARHNEHQP